MVYRTKDRTKRRNEKMSEQEQKTELPEMPEDLKEALTAIANAKNKTLPGILEHAKA
jgi:hypothetical protein